ncbi:MAG TPA: oligopeptide/dipeptide ABC transporter ATP-binding protein [Pirellulales bacterium]|jgi:oligopeptide/dipeptide ABC transporter ATP-binding protein|nr:oligopeptide/dipeptide ABC transporter ATP-binding protein [Pirellulales bacterium]
MSTGTLAPGESPGAKESSGATALLEVRDLAKWFPVRGGLFSRVRQHVRAVDGVSFSLGRGRTLGLVGESGCGKTTVGRTILRLISPTAGQVLFEGQSVFDLPRRELRALRRKMQIIFQDPYGSLNPRMTVGATVAEPLVIHGVKRRRHARERVAELLSQVGLNAEAMNRYPHEFSGGQRQRVGIARALALNPAFIVCDEPTSALDVSIRAQVINLLGDLQQQHGIAYLMISHDLGAVRHVSHEVAVMYLGKIVEQAPTEALFDDPRHPYTRVLLAAIPVPDPTKRRPKIVATDDEIPSPINIPSGCPFHPRCPLYELKGKPETCRRDVPPLRPIAEANDHLAACHFAEESAALASS